MQPSVAAAPLRSVVNSRAGRMTFIFFVPATVVLYFWILVAPDIYGVSGWGGLGVLFFLGPATILFIVVVIGLVLASPARPRGFTRPQAITVWALWMSMLLAGAFFADAGDDTPSGPSVFTHFFGQSSGVVSLGDALSLVFFWLMVLAAFALLVQLVAGVFSTRRRFRVDRVS